MKRGVHLTVPNSMYTAVPAADALGAVGRDETAPAVSSFDDDNDWNW